MPSTSGETLTLDCRGVALLTWVDSHTFKCKSEDEANAITYAAARMISANAIRKRPADVSVATTDEKNEAMNWWNACNSPLYHFRLNPVKQHWYGRMC